jgi:hypothetical protein
LIYKRISLESNFRHPRLNRKLKPMFLWSILLCLCLPCLDLLLRILKTFLSFQLSLNFNVSSLKWLHCFRGLLVQLASSGKIVANLIGKNWIF